MTEKAPARIALIVGPKEDGRKAGTTYRTAQGWTYVEGVGNAPVVNVFNTVPDHGKVSDRIFGIRAGQSSERYASDLNRVLPEGYEVGLVVGWGYDEPMQLNHTLALLIPNRPWDEVRKLGWRDIQYDSESPGMSGPQA
jgi:hypothetical protein